MTALAPDMPILPRLERLGAALLVADSTANAMMARGHLTEAARRYLRDDVRAKAAAEAVRELDGMYSVTAETAGLIRALQAACAIEELHRLGTPIAGDLRTAVWHLSRAARAVQTAMARVQVEQDLAAGDERNRADTLALWDELTAGVAQGRRAAA